MNSKNGADSIDWKILELLQQNARLSNTEIGKLVGLSQPAVTSRIARLEHSGAIQGYSARIDPKRLGREISVIIRIKITPQQLRQCVKALDKIPEIIEACRITGEDCLFVKAVFERMEEVQNTIDLLGQFGSTTTSFIVSTLPPKPLTDSKREERTGTKKPSSNALRALSGTN